MGMISAYILDISRLNGNGICAELAQAKMWPRLLKCNEDQK